MKASATKRLVNAFATAAFLFAATLAFSQDVSSTARENATEAPKTAEPLFEYVPVQLPEEGLTDFERYVLADISRFTQELNRGNALTFLAHTDLFFHASFFQSDSPYYPNPKCPMPRRRLMNFEIKYNNPNSGVATDLTIMKGGFIITLSNKDGFCSGTMKYRVGYDYDTVARFAFHPNGMLRSIEYNRVYYLGYAVLRAGQVSGELRKHYGLFIEALNEATLNGAESKDVFTRGVDNDEYRSHIVEWDASGNIVESDKVAQVNDNNAVIFDFPILSETDGEPNSFHRTRNRPGDILASLSANYPYEPRESFAFLSVVYFNSQTDNLNERDRQKTELITQLTRVISESTTFRELKEKFNDFPFAELFEADPSTVEKAQPFTVAFKFDGDASIPCEISYESPIGRFSASNRRYEGKEYELVEVLNADGKSGCSINRLASGVVTDMFFHSGKEPLIAPFEIENKYGVGPEDWKNFLAQFEPIFKAFDDSMETLGLNDIKVNYVNTPKRKTRVVKHIAWAPSGEYLGQISWSKPVNYREAKYAEPNKGRYYLPDSRVGVYKVSLPQTPNYFNTVYYGGGKAVVADGIGVGSSTKRSSSDPKPVDPETLKGFLDDNLIPVAQASNTTPSGN